MDNLFETYSAAENQATEEHVENQRVWTKSAIRAAPENKNFVFSIFGYPIEQWQIDFLTFSVQLTMLILNIFLIIKTASR